MIFNFFFKKEIVITNSPGQFRKLSLISPKTSDNFQKVVNYFRNLSIISEIAHIAKEFCKFLSNFSVFSFFSLSLSLHPSKARNLQDLGIEEEFLSFS